MTRRKLEGACDKTRAGGNAASVVVVDPKNIMLLGQCVLDEPDVESLVSTRDDLVQDLSAGFEAACPGFRLACVPVSPVAPSIHAPAPDQDSSSSASKALTAQS